MSSLICFGRIATIDYQENFDSTKKWKKRLIIKTCYKEGDSFDIYSWAAWDDAATKYSQILKVNMWVIIRGYAKKRGTYWNFNISGIKIDGKVPDDQPELSDEMISSLESNQPAPKKSKPPVEDVDQLSLDEDFL